MRLKLALLLFLAAGFSSPASASTCNVNEFPLQVNGGVQAVMVPPLVDQVPITTSSTSAQSAAFAPSTGLVRVWCDTQSAVAFGSNPTATTNNMPLSAGATEYFAIVPGQKAAFILRP
jgi:predicted deacylase